MTQAAAPITTAPLLVVDQVTRTYQLPREKLWHKPPLFTI